MFVKICGITNEDDALLAVAMGADAVGFVFAPSPRQIAVQQAYDITRRLPPEVLTVGVFRDEHPKRVVELVNRAGVKAAQLHGGENAEAVAEVARSVRWVIKAYPAGSPKVAAAASLATDLILLDAPSPGSGHVFDWTLAGEVPEGMRLILAGGLDPDNVADAVKAVEPWGVDVSSGVESSPGKKDALKVRYFINNAKAYEDDDDNQSRDGSRAGGTSSSARVRAVVAARTSSASRVRGTGSRCPASRPPARTNATCSLTSGAPTASAQAARWVTRAGSTGSVPPRDSRTPCGTTRTPRPRSSVTPRDGSAGARASATTSVNPRSARPATTPAISGRQPMPRPPGRVPHPAGEPARAGPSCDTVSRTPSIGPFIGALA